MIISESDSYLGTLVIRDPIITRSDHFSLDVGLFLQHGKDWKIQPPHFTDRSILFFAVFQSTSEKSGSSPGLLSYICEVTDGRLQPM